MDINTLMLLGIAALNAFTAWMTWRTSEDILQTKKDVRKIELATNSMHDALVATTAKASHAVGKAEGRAEVTAEDKAQEK